MKSVVVALFLIGLAAARHNTHEFGPEIPLVSRQFPSFMRRGALDSLKAITGVELEVTDQYTDDHNQVTHIWTRQMVKGLPVWNGVGNMNLDVHGQVISNYDRFTDNVAVTSREPKLTPVDALLKLGEFVHQPVDKEVLLLEIADGEHDYELDAGNYSVGAITADLMWIQLEDRSLELIWEVNVNLDDHWYDASVSTTSGEVLQIHDFVHYFSYNVYPVGIQDPEDTPGTRRIEQEPSDPAFAPIGWHNVARFGRNTQGNNVRAQENFSGNINGWENNFRPTADANDAFDFPINLNLQPREYISAAITNLFFHNNIIHDIYYQYGFNEVSGNFQFDNFGRGGLQNDGVTAQCQDGSGFNNANFATPSDGSPGRMRMYVWNGWNPNKDGDLDAGIIYHEYAHGISNRLTGGPTTTGCLSGGGQPSGMGEGWGDFSGLMFRHRAEYNRNMVFGTGTYVTQGITIRNWVYSSDRNQAPQLYTFIDGIPIHQIGCVWSTLLYEVYWNLVDAFGFDADWLYGNGGNNRAIQIVTDGMKFQPCRPAFVDARDSILDSALQQFDQLTWCLAWDGFASRGLGVGAPRTPTFNNFDVPAGCAEIIARAGVTLPNWRANL